MISNYTADHEFLVIRVDSKHDMNAVKAPIEVLVPKIAGRTILKTGEKSFFCVPTLR